MHKNYYQIAIFFRGIQCLLQETWLLKSQISTINQYLKKSNTGDISGMNKQCINTGHRISYDSAVFQLASIFALFISSCQTSYPYMLYSVHVVSSY